MYWMWCFFSENSRNKGYQINLVGSATTGMLLKELPVMQSSESRELLKRQPRCANWCTGEKKKGKLNVVAVGKWIQSLDFFIGWMAGRWCWGFGCSCSIRQFLQVRPFLELAACQAGCHIEIELYVFQCVCWSMILPVQCTTRAVSLSQTSRLQIQLDSTGHAWIYQESLLALVGCDFFILQAFDATCRHQHASIFYW